MDFLIGTPYSFRDFNCWDYVAKVRKDNGIDTKLFNVKSLHGAFKLIREQTQKLDHGLTIVNTKQNFDIVIAKKDDEYHCGLYFDGYVVHCSRQLKQVVKEKFADFIKPYESYTLWR